MNKVLIGTIVVISAYLAYNTFNSEPTTSPTITAASVADNQQNIDQAVEVEQVYDNQSSYLDGSYVLNITTDTTETSQVFNFSKNGSFELSRHMISPNPALSGTIAGSYTISGNTVNLLFPADRDKKTFAVDKAKMTIKSETELNYGGFIAYLD